MKDIKKLYDKRRDKLNTLLAKQTKAADMISNLRLLVFFTGIAGSVILYLIKLYYMFAAVLTVSLVLFIWLIILHGKMLENKKYSSLLVKINEDSLKRINGEWVTFRDNGEDFTDTGHSFSYDLDLFGNGSLFQWINTANTYLGRLSLKDLFTTCPGTPQDIYKRQEAVAELADRLKWRQRFQAESLARADKMHSPDDLVEWAGERYEFFTRGWVVLGIRVIPAVTAALLISAFVLHIIPGYIPVLAFIIQFILMGIKRKKRDGIFGTSAMYKDEIKAYYKMMKLLEEQEFSSRRIREIKSGMRDTGGLTASRQIDRLSKIIDSTSQRYNGFYFIFNVLTLWDYHNLVRLEKWKIRSGKLIRNWLEAIAEVEALSSLAVIRFEHPKWAMPEIDTANTVYEAEDMGHPLLTNSGVHNDVKILAPAKVLLITGSNMSGKSTLLRTAGINLVLAYAGAPACAGAFRVSIMNVYTCMRVSDNLGKSISSFYAELLRIKTIVEAAGRGENIFFLLDEIFKGTNSKDRHTGARVLIRELCETSSIGLVSTHDLELCDLEGSNSKVVNYNFQEYYKEDGIHFDYRLRRGASTTRNAVYLMKMAGIDIKND